MRVLGAEALLQSKGFKTLVYSYGLPSFNLVGIRITGPQNKAKFKEILIRMGLGTYSMECEKDSVVDTCYTILVPREVGQTGIVIGTRV